MADTVTEINKRTYILVMYCFFVIEHGRRKILHFNVTKHPMSCC
jgi:hypothetical protein